MPKDSRVHGDPRYPLKLSHDIDWKTISSKVDVINLQVFAVVRPDGCVTLAFPLVPSGIQSIDTSATRDIFMARFLPAVIDGKDITASISIPIRFARKK